MNIFDRGEVRVENKKLHILTLAEDRIFFMNSSKNPDKSINPSSMNAFIYVIPFFCKKAQGY